MHMIAFMVVHAAPVAGVPTRQKHTFFLFPCKRRGALTRSGLLMVPAASITSSAAVLLVLGAHPLELPLPVLVELSTFEEWCGSTNASVSFVAVIVGKKVRKQVNTIMACKICGMCRGAIFRGLVPTRRGPVLRAQGSRKKPVWTGEGGFRSLVPAIARRPPATQSAPCAAPAHLCVSALPLGPAGRRRHATY